MEKIQQMNGYHYEVSRLQGALIGVATLAEWEGQMEFYDVVARTLGPEPVGEAVKEAQRSLILIVKGLHALSYLMRSE
jgi:hypothetical protein